VSRIQNALLIIGFSLIALALPAEARKFDFKSESMAAYFRGTYGNTRLSDGMYSSSSGFGTVFDKKPQRNISAEFGFLFGIGGPLTLRLAGELLMPQRFEDINGTNSAGTALFTLKSEVLAYLLMSHIEYSIPLSPRTRFYLDGGVGLAQVTVDQTYTMTTAGAAALVPSYNETAVNRVTALSASLGYEFVMSDVVTAAFDLGYRHIPVSRLDATKAVTAIAGNEANGSSIKNGDGTDRIADLSGFFLGLAFRFYL
jgi:opacity protein-like surface antigen